MQIPVLELQLKKENALHNFAQVRTEPHYDLGVPVAEMETGRVKILRQAGQKTGQILLFCN